MEEKIAEISWEEVCEEYPKLEEKVGSKYSYLRSVNLEIFKTNEFKDEQGIYFAYITKYKDAGLEWCIPNDKYFSIREMYNRRIEGIGPLLVLGTWLYITKYCKNKIDTTKNIEIMEIVYGGPKFWANFFGFEDFKEVIKLSTEKHFYWAGNRITLHIPYEKIKTLIEKEWK